MPLRHRQHNALLGILVQRQADNISCGIVKHARNHHEGFGLQQLPHEAMTLAPITCLARPLGTPRSPIPHCKWQCHARRGRRRTRTTSHLIGRGWRPQGFKDFRQTCQYFYAGDCTSIDKSMSSREGGAIKWRDGDRRLGPGSGPSTGVSQWACKHGYIKCIVDSRGHR